MAAIKFLFPLSGTRVGPLPLNDPPQQTRGRADPERSFTRIVVQTTDTVATDEVTLVFDHKEPGSVVPSFVKSTADGTLKRVVAEGSGFKYRTFFQFITKAAGLWSVQATVKRGGAVVAEETIQVRVLTTLWPFYKVDAAGHEIDIHGPHGATIHGHSWFRPMENPVVRNHNIPFPDRNTNTTAFADRHDAIDFHAKVGKEGRAPFNGKIVHKHLISDDPKLGHYIHLDGKIVTTSGHVVRYRACIAHFTVSFVVGDQLLIGQPLGKQATKSFLHFALVNLDDATGPQPVGCITGDAALLPPTGHGNRQDFLALSPAEKKKKKQWQDATAYYASMRDNMRVALLQKKFGH